MVFTSKIDKLTGEQVGKEVHKIRQEATALVIKSKKLIAELSKLSYEVQDPKFRASLDKAVSKLEDTYRDYFWAWDDVYGSISFPKD